MPMIFFNGKTPVDAVLKAFSATAAVVAPTTAIASASTKTQSVPRKTGRVPSLTLDGGSKIAFVAK